LTRWSDAAEAALLELGKSEVRSRDMQPFFKTWRRKLKADMS
jgi:hypothetical protein